MDIGQTSTVCAPLPGSELEQEQPLSGGSRETHVPSNSGCSAAFTAAADRGDSPRGSTALGRFDLLERIGAGSFGEVWKAYDALLDRFVAIKVARTPVAGRLTGDMLAEARLAAQLRHPNIVRVHEIDARGNTVFIVSDLIDGGTLAEWRTALRPAIRTAVEMLEKIARALHHAHQRGVIHRDLKPGNIMVGRDGEPYLVDFGLGLRAEPRGQAEESRSILGTPSYMSPEQARGDSQLADGRSDVYSLGVILFELLTGRLPFAERGTELLQKLPTLIPPSPRQFNPDISRDLEQVCLKCLAKSPADRYASALDFADDLACVAAHRPVRARPVGYVARIGRFIRRHPIGSAAALLLLSALTLSSVSLRHKHAARTDLVVKGAAGGVLHDALWTLQIIARARSAHYATALAEADRASTGPPLPPARYYDLACVYAVACSAVREDEDLREPPRQELLAHCRRAACALLRRARDGGYFDSPDRRRHLGQDAHLESLRDEPEFIRLLTSLQEDQT